MAKKRPPLITVAVIIVGIPAGIAVLTGSYLLLRPPSGTPLAMIGLSFTVGLVLMVGLNAMWERKYGGWPLAVAAMGFGLAASLVSQLALWPGTTLAAIGVSWVTTLVSSIAILILASPSIRAYYESRGE